MNRSVGASIVAPSLPGLTAGSVRYDPDRQITLIPRREITKRLLILLGESAVGREFGNKAAAEQLKTCLEISMNLRTQHNRGRPTLDGAFEVALQEADNRLRHLFDEDEKRAIKSAVQHALDHIDCRKCSVHEGGCGHRPGDIFFFEDGELEGALRRGGLCVDFVRSLSEWSLAVTKEFAKKHKLAATSSDGEILVRMKHDEMDGASTLNVNGRMYLKEDPPVLEISWPRRTESFEAAILQLPYLIFHEIFVHGTQGCLLENPPRDLQDSCAFTEGLIDAIACEELKARLSVEDGDERGDTGSSGEETPVPLPPILSPLRLRFFNEAYEYDKARALGADVQSPSKGRTADRIRSARSAGRRTLVSLKRMLGDYVTATGLSMSGDDWTARLAFELHMRTHEGERRVFFDLLRLAANWPPHWRTKAVAALELYQAQPCNACLLERLNALKAAKLDKSGRDPLCGEGWLEALERTRCPEHVF